MSTEVYKHNNNNAETKLLEIINKFQINIPYTSKCCTFFSLKMNIINEKYKRMLNVENIMCRVFSKFKEGQDTVGGERAL